MKIIPFTEMAKLDFAITDISVIYQTPQWTTLGKRQRPRSLNGFLLIDEGECRYDWDGHCAKLQTGSLIYLPRGSRKTVTVTARPFSFYRICFNITDLADGEDVIFTHTPCIITDNAHQKLFELSAELVTSTLSESKRYRSLSLMAEMLHSISKRFVPQSDSHIAPALRFLESHYAEPTDMDHLASLCALSKPHLYRLFKSELATSPTRYRNALRIERAKKLLADGECTVSEISEMLGFESVYYFSRVFKSHTGASPTNYNL